MVIKQKKKVQDNKEKREAWFSEQNDSLQLR